jgi:hypothetical protein
MDNTKPVNGDRLYLSREDVSVLRLAFAAAVQVEDELREMGRSSTALNLNVSVTQPLARLLKNFT